MNRLLQADFERLKKHRAFWICVLAIAGYGMLSCFAIYREMIRYDSPRPIDSVFFQFMVILGIVLAVFCSLFIGTEYSDGTIRNKLVIGRSRAGIYLSGFVTCAGGAVFLYVLTVVVNCAVGIPLFGAFETELSAVFGLLVIGMLLTLAYVSIYHMITMLNSSKAHASIICLLISFTLLFLGIWVNSALKQPKEYESGVVLNGQTSLEKIENPSYLTGSRRELYQFYSEVNPGGQTIQITAMEAEHPFRLAGYSIGIILISNVTGILLFRKKDIK